MCLHSACFLRKFHGTKRRHGTKEQIYRVSQKSISIYSLKAIVDGRKIEAGSNLICLESENQNYSFLLSSSPLRGLSDPRTLSDPELNYVCKNA